MMGKREETGAAAAADPAACGRRGLRNDLSAAPGGGKSPLDWNKRTDILSL